MFFPFVFKLVYSFFILEIFTPNIFQSMSVIFFLMYDEVRWSVRVFMIPVEIIFIFNFVVFLHFNRCNFIFIFVVNYRYFRNIYLECSVLTKYRKKV